MMARPGSPENSHAKTYSKLEESINVGSHAIGVVLSVVALIALSLHPAFFSNLKTTLSFTVFGLSLICLYLASTFYHASRDPRRRARLRVIDHAAIYVLIAGTYTPFTLITLNSTLGWVLFGISWGLALVGVVLKLRYTGQYSKLSTAMYLIMGWLIIFAITPLRENLDPNGMFWLVLGGIAYSVGAIIYGIRKIPMNHAIFHLFILIGSASHFVAVYFYILPAGQ